MRPDCLKYDNCSIPIRLCDDDCSDLLTVEEVKHPFEDEGEQGDYLLERERDKKLTEEWENEDA
jgi:hypothetical protein